MKLVRAATFLIWFGVLVVLFQNCQPGFAPSRSNESLSSISPIDESGGTGVRFPDSEDPANPGANNPPPVGANFPKFDQECLNSNEADACVIWKNVVAQKGQALTFAPTFATSLAPFQIYAVKMTGLDNSGYLQNSSVTVNITDGTRLQKDPQTGWRFASGANDSQHKLAQLMSYYWLTEMEKFYSAYSGHFAAQKNITVDAFKASSGGSAYSHSTNSLTLGNYRFGTNNVGQMEGGLFAEVSIHEMGHANFSFATNKAIWAMSTAVHKKCDPNGDTSTSNICCVSKAGCTSAMNEAVSDLHYLFMFPESPGFHNVISNSLAGLKELNLPRNPETFTAMNLSMDQVYNWGPSQGSFQFAGQSHLMSRVYTAAWWNVYKAVSSQGPAAQTDIKKIFVEHLPLMTGADTFSTALAKILSTENRLTQDKYKSIFATEFGKWGIFAN